MEKASSQNWTEYERTSAVEIILRNEDVIFGRLKGSTSDAKEKEKNLAVNCRRVKRVSSLEHAFK